MNEALNIMDHTDLLLLLLVVEVEVGVGVGSCFSHMLNMQMKPEDSPFSCSLVCSCWDHSVLLQRLNTETNCVLVM